MGTKNNPGAFDCYNNAEPDEPMFVLLGRDPDAPELVELWVARRRARGENAAKLEEARRCAETMREWRRANWDRRRRSPLDSTSTAAGALPLLRLAAAHAHAELAGALRAEAANALSVSDSLEVPARVVLLEERARRHEARVRALLLDMTGAAPSPADYANAVVGVES